MISQDYVDIVIPVYNEGDNILSLLACFEMNVHSNIRVLICYDHDADTTLSALNNYDGSIKIIRVKNKGSFAHGAVMTGFDYSDAQAVISYMADDDYNAVIVDKMIDLSRAGNDIVCASRFMPGGSMVGCPWPKSFLVRIASFLLYHVGRLPSHDATNAFRLFSRRALNGTTIESTEGFTYSLELLAKAHRLGLNIAETPAQWFERVHGNSRFQVFMWAKSYFRWFFYVFETTYLRFKNL